MKNSRSTVAVRYFLHVKLRIDGTNLRLVLRISDNIGIQHFIQLKKGI